MLSYVDVSLHAVVGGMKDATKMLRKLTDVSERYQSDGQSLASGHLWPYRCYNAETTKVLDVYLSDVLLQIVALVRNRDERLAMFLHGVFMNIPQFQGYVGEMVKASLTSMCSLIEESQSRELTVQSILKVLEKLSTETQVACLAPHNNHDFCLLSKIVTPLQLFLMDYKNAGSSVILRRFAFFWFFEPNLSHFCSDSGEKFKAKVLSSFASSEVKELKAIVEFSTQQDYQKIRSFISQHVFNHFTHYLTGETETPRSKSELGPPFHKREYPSEKPTYNFLKCFRVFLTTLLQMDEAISSHGPAAKIRALAKVSLLWFTHPEFGAAKITDMRETFLEGLDYILQDTAVLKTFGMSLGGCGERVCRTGANGSSPLPFCEINEVLEGVHLLATSLSFSPKTKILTPLTAEYRRMLSDEGFWSIPSTVDEIGKETKKQRRWRKSFVSMGNKIRELFARSANLAHTEAGYNAKALLGMIKSFLRRLGEVDFAGKLSRLFREVFQLAGPKDFTEVAKALASAIVNSPNPFRWLTDIPSVQDVLRDRADRAISGNANRQLERIFGDTSRLLHVKALEISKAVASKSKFHENIKKLLKSLTENNADFKNDGLDESEQVNRDNTMEFLREHTKSNSIIFLSRKDIEEYTALAKDLIEKSCDILHKRKTTNPSASTSQTIKTACLNIRKDARLTSAIFKEMHKFQFEFMQIIASISRATSIQQQSNKLSKKILRRTIDSVSELKPEIHKYQIKVQAKMHIHQAVSAICDEIEYKNGGVQIEACLKASLTLVQDDVMGVLAVTNNECPSAQTRNLHVRIPASLNPNKEFLETGHIDLTSLYKGKVTVFEIPFSENLPWLHKFASSELPESPDIAMYVKRFELFLPDMTDPLQPIAYDLKIAIDRGNFNKPMPSREIKYAFADPKGFHLSYGENKKQCIMGLKDSPYPKLCEQPSPICIERRGELLANETAPSLYRKWLIQASIPRGLPMPRPYPGTAFYLRAVMSICVSNPKNIDLGGTLACPVTITSLSGDCCPKGGFWNIDQYLPSVQFCLQCPQNSNPMLGGLYCHDTTQSVRSKKSKSKKKIS